MNPLELFQAPHDGRQLTRCPGCVQEVPGGEPAQAAGHGCEEPMVSEWALAVMTSRAEFYWLNMHLAWARVRQQDVEVERLRARIGTLCEELRALRTRLTGGLQS
jgi:hypothetical protein